MGLVGPLIQGVTARKVGNLIHRPFWRHGFATEAARALKHERKSVIPVIKAEEKTD